nr:trimethylamine methyltransferase family protein [Kiloniellales bacterium]
LGSSQTLELMEKEYVYPRLGDRSTPEEWQQRGGSDIRARALVRVREILAEHYPAHIDPALDAEIRARFPIHLPEAAMTPARGRW